MCLIVKKGDEICHVDREVECWKVLRKDEDGKLYSPFYGVEYRLGEEKVLGDWEEMKVDEYPCGYLGTYYAVNHGLHTYAVYDDAAVVAVCGRVVVRCVIPVGARCISGFLSSEDREHGYVSDRLVVKEEVRYRRNKSY